MTTQQTNEEVIFNTARKIESAEAREEYLAQVCAGDLDLRNRVEALLQSQAAESQFLESPALDPTCAFATIREQLEFTDVPIYGVSGLKQHEAKVPTGDRGVSGWFAKPVNADKLLAQIFHDIGANPDLTGSEGLN